MKILADAQWKIPLSAAILLCVSIININVVAQSCGLMGLAARDLRDFYSQLKYLLTSVLPLFRACMMCSDQVLKLGGIKNHDKNYVNVLAASHLYIC